MRGTCDADGTLARSGRPPKQPVLSDVPTRDMHNRENLVRNWSRLTSCDLGRGRPFIQVRSLSVVRKWSEKAETACRAVNCACQRTGPTVTCMRRNACVSTSELRCHSKR